VNTRFIGTGDRKKETSTSTGATKRAIWMLEPMAMVSARSMRFFAAIRMAVECSAALPTTATTMTPMKTSFIPRCSAVASTEPTITSATQAMTAVEPSSTASERPRLHASPCPSRSASPTWAVWPEKSFLWV
jgi:hypothetical protein